MRCIFRTIAAVLCIAISAGSISADGEAAEVFRASENTQVPFESVEVSDEGMLHCPQGYSPAAENDSMVLYVDEKNGGFANYDKVTDTLWFSTPENADTDALAGSEEKSRMHSQLYLEYYDEYNNSYTYNSYDHSAVNHTLECFRLDGGVEIVYTIINYTRTIADIPEWISASRFKKYFLDPATEDERKILEKRFAPTEDGTCYQRYTIPHFELKKLFALMDRSGYDSAQLAYDREENRERLTGAEQSGKTYAQFIIPVRITLEEQAIVVSIPGERIRVTEGYHLYKLRLNEYFGAAGSGEEGYIIIPDGCGALIPFDNGGKDTGEIVLPVYGSDEDSQSKSLILQTEHARLPIFGIVRGKTGMIGIIEEGKAVSEIVAISGGVRSNYNRVCAAFTVEQKGVVTLDDQSAQTVFETNPYTGSFTIRYLFSDEASSDYAGLAGIYRRYLFGDERNEQSPGMPAYLNVLGSIDKLKQFLCFTYFDDEVLTDYSETMDIARELAVEGVTSLNVRYNGLLKGGVRHYPASRPALNDALGSEKELADLSDMLELMGGRLFAEISIVRTYYNGKGVSYNRDIAKSLSQNAMRLYEYSPVTYQAVTENTLRRGLAFDYVLSAHKMISTAQKVGNFGKEKGIPGWYLNDLGTLIFSDQNKRSPIDREASRETAVNAVDSLSGFGLLANGGNAEVLPLVDGILNIPQKSSGYHGEDRSVPFYQIVMHGQVDYAGEAINLCSDPTEAFLKAIETGASIQFCIMNAEEAVLKNTSYDSYFSVRYANWKDRMTTMYRGINEALSGCRGSYIIGHEKLDDQLYRTSYSNGYEIYVNYADEAVSLSLENRTVHVEARSYYVDQ